MQARGRLATTGPVAGSAREAGWGAGARLGGWRRARLGGRLLALGSLGALLALGRRRPVYAPPRRLARGGAALGESLCLDGWLCPLGYAVGGPGGLVGLLGALALLRVGPRACPAWEPARNGDGRG